MRQRWRPSNLRRVAAGLATALAAYYMILGNIIDFAAAEGAKLKVQMEGNYLRVTNIGADDIEIVDILINNRDECTRSSSDAIIRHSDGCFVAAGLLTPAVQHALWLGQTGHGPSLVEKAEGDYPSMSASCPRVRASFAVEQIILKVGDFATWQASCLAEIISATIKTNHGAATYGPQ